MKRNKYYRTYRRDQYRPYRPRFEIFSLDNENRGGEAWRWICSYIISEKLYCSGLITGVDNLKKVKKVCISKIYKASVSNTGEEGGNYREINCEEKKLKIGVNLYFL